MPRVTYLLSILSLGFFSAGLTAALIAGQRGLAVVDGLWVALLLVLLWVHGPKAGNG